MDNREVVVATYRSESIFVIPKGIDIHNTEEVETWYVRYDMLHIIMNDGRVIEVAPYSSAKEDDFKYPDENTIEPAHDHDIDANYKDEEYVE